MGSAPGMRLVAAWLAVVLGVLLARRAPGSSTTPMPALPAAALLGRGAPRRRACAGRAYASRRAWLVGAARAGGGRGPRRARAGPARRGSPGSSRRSRRIPLESLARPALLVGQAPGLLAVAALFVRRRPALALAAGSALSAALVVVVQLAHERVEPLFSWRPIALRISSAATRRGSVSSSAPATSTSSCGGLAYYLGGGSGSTC